MRDLEIQDPWLSYIQQGTKTVEGRVGPIGKFDEVLAQPGYNLLLKNDQQQFPVKLVKVVHYPDLESYLRSEGWERVAPHTGSFEVARSAYLAIEMTNEDGKIVSVFSPERISKLGGINALHIVL